MASRTIPSFLILAAAMSFASAPSQASSLLDILIPHQKAPAHHARSRLHQPPKAIPGGAATATPPVPADNPLRPPVPEPAPAPTTAPLPDAKPAKDSAVAADDIWPDAPVPDLGIAIGPMPPVAAPAGSVEDALGPVIPAMPMVPAAEAATAPPVPEPNPAKEATAEPERRPQPDADAIAACRAGLAALDVVAEAEPPFFEGACGAADPSLVKALEAGAVTVTPAAEVDCRVATALATWIHDDVQPAARATYGAPLTRLRIAGAYVCRSRNHVEGAELSEHAFMNAIDIGGYDIAGRTITIADGPSRTPIDAAFLDQVRKAACVRFMTVIGPGTDADHADNLHLDMIRRGRNGDGRICQ